VTTVHFHTFGCKANQYDTERMRQEVEARGARAVGGAELADVVVVNTCTVTNQADADARRFIRRVHRQHPTARIVVAGCSAALKGAHYRRMDGVAGVVEGHEPAAVAAKALPRIEHRATPSDGPSARGTGLVLLDLRAPLDRIHTEPVGAELLERRDGATRGWLKVQDGCDRHCGFCATRLARGASRSRAAREVVAEAKLLAAVHPELVVTGIHIGHYGRDLPEPTSLSALLARLLSEVPDVRFRLGSVEATEVDDLLLELLATSGGRLAPHLHMPLQSGADPVLRRMRRWHTREAYRQRALQIAERVPVLGLGADVITGFPGERDADHDATAALVEELPFTYVHVFPFSPRDDTHAAELHRHSPVPQRVAGERSKDLRARIERKARAYRRSRVGGTVEVALEGDEPLQGLTGDYLRVRVKASGAPPKERLHVGVLEGDEDHLYIDLSPSSVERERHTSAAAPAFRRALAR
jgi:threonylcarbamoyladenosine tRNA methylthiotransferase MtaB